MRVKCLSKVWEPEFISPPATVKPDVVAHVHNPSIVGAGTGK